ncbi:hypothetical protein ACVWZV_008969 [Bradyrhizobium sp. GM5.1]
MTSMLTTFNKIGHTSSSKRNRALSMTAKRAVVALATGGTLPMTQHPFELIVPGELGRPVTPKLGGAPDKLILGVPYVGQTAQLVLGCVRDDARSFTLKVIKTLSGGISAHSRWKLLHGSPTRGTLQRRLGQSDL